MFSSNNKVSVKQLEALFLLNIFGTGIIIMPKIATEAAGQNGWIIVIIGCVAALALSFLMNKMNQLFPMLSFVEITKKVLTKPVGYLLSLLLIARITMLIGLELRIFDAIIKVYLLPNTPGEIIILSALICAGYLSYHGYETRARLSEILIIVVVLPLIFVFVMAVFGSDFTNLLPFGVDIFQNEITLTKWGIACAIVFFNFRGMQEIFLIYPFLNDTSKAQKGYSKSIIVGGAFMLFVYIITVARFGVLDLKTQTWPLLRMMDTIELPGSFVEKQNAFIMSFWIVSVFMIISGGLYFAAHLAKMNLRLKHFRPALIPVGVLAYIISLLPRNESEAFEWMVKVDIYSGALFFIAVPIIVIIIAKIRRLA